MTDIQTQIDAYYSVKKLNAMDTDTAEIYL